MKYTNINISNNNGYLYPYMVALDETPISVNGTALKYVPLDEEKIAIFEPSSTNNISRDVNDFNEVSEWTEESTGVTNYKITKLRLYWPTDAVDTYDKTHYVFIATVHISGTEIILASRLLSRIDDALGCPEGVQRFGNNEYVECTDIEIIDPLSIIFDDEWDSFRKSVCTEPVGSNNESSQIGFSLIPVEKSRTEGTWIMKTGYVGAQNSINLTQNDTGLRMNIRFDMDDPSYSGSPMIICDAIFNPVYENDLVLYLQETYDIVDPVITYELLVSKDRMVAVSPTNADFEILTKKSALTTEPHYSIGAFMFNDWDEYVPGLLVNGVINIYDRSLYEPETELEDMDELFSIRSNPLPITQNEFRFLTTNNNNHRIYDLSQLDMDTFNLTIPNITKKEVITYDNVSDSKANIIQPIFFKSFDLEFITLHPAVTENISINLDIYKSKVEVFQIQIEGIPFTEIGRVSSGVVFQIAGNRLPKEQTDGNYYILDQDGVLVTSGKYTYEI